MRLGGFSLLALLAVLAIVALLVAHALSSSGLAAGPSGAGPTYPNAISAAQRSVAQQDAAATSAGTLGTP